MGAGPRRGGFILLVEACADDEPDRLRACEPGANGRARKPIDFGEFVAKVGRVGSGWTSVNEPPALPGGP